MRNLMVCALAAYCAILALVESLGFGNTGLWLAFVSFLGARGLGQAIAFPRLARDTFRTPAPAALEPAA